jgi:hypothetical protein
MEEVLLVRTGTVAHSRLRVWSRLGCGEDGYRQSSVLAVRGGPVVLT